MDRSIRPVPLAAVIAVLVAGVVASPASAAPLATTISTQLLTYCASGIGPPNKQLYVKLVSADNGFEGSAKPMSDGSGYWHTCDFWDSVQPTDRIIVSDGTNSRTFIVPSLTLKMDRASDVVSGKGVPNSSVTINVQNCQSFDTCSPAATKTRPTSSTGDYSYDFTSMYNIRGQDLIDVALTTTAGDTVAAHGYVPHVAAWLRNSYVTGRAGAGTSSVTLKLLTSGGTLRASVTRLLDTDYGNFSGRFKTAGGDPVNSLPTNKVTASFSSDASISIIDTLIGANTATDHVIGKCYPNRAFYIDVEEPQPSTRSPYYDVVYGYADASGNFNVSVSGGGFDLQPLDIVYVECMTPKGDVLSSMYEVPA